MCRSRNSTNRTRRLISMWVKQTNRTGCSGRSVQSVGRFMFGLLMVFAFMQALMGSALASCGDYLFHNRDHHNLQLTLDDLTSHEINPELPIPSNPAVPCSGPHCRSNPEPTVPIPTPRSVTWSSETAILLQTNSVTLPEWYAPIFPVSHRELASGGCSIFRPPCVG